MQFGTVSVFEEIDKPLMCQRSIVLFPTVFEVLTESAVEERRSNFRSRAARIERTRLPQYDVLAAEFLFCVCSEQFKLAVERNGLTNFEFTPSTVE